MMMHLKRLLLDLISERQTITQQQLDVLTDADWATICEMAMSHRIAPLLYWQLKQKMLVIPVSVSERLRNIYKKSAIRAVKMQAELLKLHQLLSSQRIHHIALKGSYLANVIYPHAALRPMRDIDLLLPQAQLAGAYEQLIKHGYRHPPKYAKYKGSSDDWLKFSKHIPPLLSPTGVIVELHHKVFHPENSPSEDLVADDNFWYRCIVAHVAGQQILFMSPTDLLLHLIMHASYDHRFNNGPLVLTDIAYLIEHCTIDWSLFWQAAQVGSSKDGCSLVLHMVKYYFPEIRIESLDDLGSKGQSLAMDAERFALLMLQDYESRAVHATLSKIKARGIVGKAKWFF
ncbi:nucleotidyltransferase family protein [Shewanella dokdonensis]|uniref:Nucleotidyltransferase family protein n=1 Tax=Shewanella dokdonensis TaxID=712036 RepID=A0ABX8DFW4_9GAMM|nr:nucleotidyltransferase family protein [Shewanella dokdonensis]